jgi:hypothetical protein
MILKLQEQNEKPKFSKSGTELIWKIQDKWAKLRRTSPGSEELKNIETVLDNVDYNAVALADALLKRDPGGVVWIYGNSMWVKDSKDHRFPPIRFLKNRNMYIQVY